MPKIKPAEYIVEFYHSSFSNDPSFSLTSSTPISGMSVGDHLFLGSWDQRMESEYGKITKIRHNIYDIAADHVTHQIGVVFEFVDKDEHYDG